MAAVTLQVALPERAQGVSAAWMPSSSHPTAAVAAEEQGVSAAWAPSSSHPTAAAAAEEQLLRTAQQSAPAGGVATTAHGGVACAGTLVLKSTWKAQTGFFVLEHNGTLAQFNDVGAYRRFRSGGAGKKAAVRTGRVLFVLFPEAMATSSGALLERPRDLLVGTSCSSLPWLVQTASSAEHCKWINALWWSLDKQNTPRKSAAKALLDYYGMHRRGIEKASGTAGGIFSKVGRGGRRKSLLQTNDSLVFRKAADGSLKCTRSSSNTPSEPDTPSYKLRTVRFENKHKLTRVREYEKLPSDELRSLFYTQLEIYNMRRQACRPFDLARASFAEWRAQFGLRSSNSSSSSRRRNRNAKVVPGANVS